MCDYGTTKSKFTHQLLTLMHILSRIKILKIISFEVKASVCFLYGIANHDIILFLHVFIRISFKFLFICVVRYVLSNYSFCLM